MTIVYTSNTGFTKAYAQLLGEQTNLPVLSMAEATKNLPEGAPVLYLGWIMAGIIKQLDKAVKRFDVKAACGVGMTIPSQRVIDNLAKSNFIADGTLFYLPGGYAPDKLKGLYKVMLTLVLKDMRKKLAEKPQRTEADFAQLEMAKNGGDMVSVENLAAVLQWIREAQPV